MIIYKNLFTSILAGVVVGCILFVFMTVCGHFSILLEKNFSETTTVSIWTGIGYSIWSYWMHRHSRSDGDRGPSKRMPRLGG